MSALTADVSWTVINPGVIVPGFINTEQAATLAHGLGKSDDRRYVGRLLVEAKLADAHPRSVGEPLRPAVGIILPGPRHSMGGSFPGQTIQSETPIRRVPELESQRRFGEHPTTTRSANPCRSTSNSTPSHSRCITRARRDSCPPEVDLWPASTGSAHREAAGVRLNVCACNNQSGIGCPDLFRIP